MYILSTIHLRCAIDTLYPCFDTFYFSRSPSSSQCSFFLFFFFWWRPLTPPSSSSLIFFCCCCYCSFSTSQSQDWDFNDKTLIGFYHFETVKKKKRTIQLICISLSVCVFSLQSWNEHQINTQTINSKSKLIDFNHDAKQFSVCLICYLYKYQFIIRLLKMISSINTRIDDGRANAVVKQNVMIFYFSPTGTSVYVFCCSHSKYTYIK